ncbi:hypothetical protein RHGRI_034596 [Rhododendron griersonianum]|uniref:Ureide permease n=1 Tax=Rhododendron griersonianum TaxID=479676 RepID=A0AAV6I4L4_9ERIC|nr:hypothetical protein RHGRI_034596 [Rhododendron griersonianum]
MSGMDISGTPSLIALPTESTLLNGLSLKIYLVESKVGAIVCMLLALFLLGTFPAILTLLERRGRLPQHSYLDYTITNFLAAVFIAFTFGEIGKSTSEEPNFLTQLSQINLSDRYTFWNRILSSKPFLKIDKAYTCISFAVCSLYSLVGKAFCYDSTFALVDNENTFKSQGALRDNWPSVLFAMAGGVVLSLGNLCSQYAWAFVGISVTEVITSSITVVVGTTANYFLDDKINKAAILFPGVGCFLIAACLGSCVHASNVADNKAKLGNLPDDYKAAAADVSVSKETHPDIVGTEDPERGTSTADKAKFGSADFLIGLENRRAIKVFGKSTMIGLAITFFAGLCFSLFSPAFNLATNDQWDTLKDGVPHLTVYTAFFYFSVSCFVLAVILNVILLYHPVLNLPKSSIRAYLTDWNGRGWAFLAGLVCGFGNGLQFMGGQAAGYAAADAVQALPLVTTFWGILIFGEYRRSSRRTYGFLVSMLFMFIVAVAVLIASAGQRNE